MNYRRNDWKHFSCVLRNHRSPKKRHRGQNLQCQLANEDDLESKSVIIEIVLRIVFYIRIEYRPSSVMKIFNSLPPSVHRLISFHKLIFKLLVNIFTLNQHKIHITFFECRLSTVVWVPYIIKNNR